MRGDNRSRDALVPLWIWKGKRALIADRSAIPPYNYVSDLKPPHLTTMVEFFDREYGILYIRVCEEDRSIYVLLHCKDPIWSYGIEGSKHTETYDNHPYSLPYPCPLVHA